MIGVAPEGVDLAKPNLEMSHGYFFFTKDQTLFAQGNQGTHINSQPPSQAATSLPI